MAVVSAGDRTIKPQDGDESGARHAPAWAQARESLPQPPGGCEAADRISPQAVCCRNATRRWGCCERTGSFGAVQPRARGLCRVSPHLHRTTTQPLLSSEGLLRASSHLGAPPGGQGHTTMCMPQMLSLRITLQSTLSSRPFSLGVSGEWPSPGQQEPLIKGLCAFTEVSTDTRPFLDASQSRRTQHTIKPPAQPNSKACNL